MKIFNSIGIILVILSLGCGNPSPTAETTTANPAEQPWSEIEKAAYGQTVQMMMWQGDPQINAYMNDYIRPLAKERYNIDLQIGSGQGNIIVQSLMAELQAGKTNSELDLLWINGETFYQLQQIKGLYGPWAKSIPNSQFIDWNNPFIGKDFQQQVDGYECPWGNVQMTLIYDSAKVASPPMTLEALETFVKSHPGKFTFDNHFTGLTFLKSLMIGIAGGPGSLDGPFDEAKYQTHSQALWSYIRRIRPYLWKEGKTFPEAVAPMHQMFGNGELWFTMSNNDAEVDNKIKQGTFPPTARAFVLEQGTIRNSHYLGIPALSSKKAASMVVANLMVSPEAQLKKMNPSVWGDGTILDVNKLPESMQQAFAALPGRQYALPLSYLQEHALEELAPEYMIRLAADFRKEIIEQ